MQFQQCLSVAITALLLVGPTDQAGEIRTGTLLSAINQTILVVDHSQHQLRAYQAAGDCTVLLNNLPASIGDLMTGDSVTLTLGSEVRRSVNRPVTKIEAYSHPLRRSAWKEQP